MRALDGQSCRCMRFQVNQELQKASFCKNNSKKSPPCVGQRTFVLVLHPLSIATRLALQVGCGSLTIMGDKEYQQKLERNQQAFEAWVEKKAAELKKGRLEAIKAEQYREEILKQRFLAGANAYQRWQENRKLEDELLQKQRLRERELLRLEKVKREKRRQQASKAFESWTQKKNAESDGLLKHSRESYRKLPSRAPTPPLPGYCSVWSCDPELADIMIYRVPRSRSHSLTETLNYSQYHNSESYA